MGVTGGLDCRPLPQRLLLISCPAALPGRGWRRVTAVFSAACLPEFQPEAPSGLQGRGVPDESISLVVSHSLQEELRARPFWPLLCQSLLV